MLGTAFIGYEAATSPEALIYGDENSDDQHDEAYRRPDHDGRAAKHLGPNFRRKLGFRNFSALATLKAGDCHSDQRASQATTRVAS